MDCNTFDFKLSTFYKNYPDSLHGSSVICRPDDPTVVAQSSRICRGWFVAQMTGNLPKERFMPEMSVNQPSNVIRCP